MQHSLPEQYLLSSKDDMSKHEAICQGGNYTNNNMSQGLPSSVYIAPVPLMTQASQILPSSSMKLFFLK